MRYLGLCEMHQVVGSHDGDGAGGYDKPLEYLRVQILAFFTTVT